MNPSDDPESLKAQRGFRVDDGLANYRPNFRVVLLRAYTGNNLVLWLHPE